MTARPAHIEAGLRDLIARQAIAQALAVHSRGIDRADATLLATARHPGASVDYGAVDGSADGFVARVTTARRQEPVTLHDLSMAYARGVDRVDVDYDWTMTLLTTHATDGMYEALKRRGCCGRSDPVYAFWKC